MHGVLNVFGREPILFSPVLRHSAVAVEVDLKSSEISLMSGMSIGEAARKSGLRPSAKPRSRQRKQPLT
jgi:hypothetical protein